MFFSLKAIMIKGVFSMALPNEPLTRAEQYLNRIATGSGTIPEEPYTRIEMYLNKIATGSGEVPEEALTRLEQYLAAIAEYGGGSSITVEPLTALANSTYIAPSGKAYSPVTVEVPSVNPNSGSVITGTLSNPWDDVNPSNLANLLSRYNATAYLRMTIPGAGTYILPVALDNRESPSIFIISGLLYSPAVGQTTPNGGCLMYSVEDGFLISAYMYVNGTLTDVATQLAQLPTVLMLIMHPLEY